MSNRKVDCMRSRHAALPQVRAHDPHTVSSAWQLYPEIHLEPRLDLYGENMAFY